MADAATNASPLDYERVTRRRRPPIRLLVVLAVGVFLLAGALLLRLKSSQPRPDIGPQLHQMGRPSVWRSQQLPLGDTGYVATVGPAFYQDDGDNNPDYYSIDVERRDGPAWHVHFQRDFGMDEIPASLIGKNIADIVSFDERTRRVIFRIGDRQERYRLPPEGR
jgi:hypothetical protein